MMNDFNFLGRFSKYCSWLLKLEIDFIIQKTASNSDFKGIRVVEKGSCKKREVGKSEVGKFLFKFERLKRSWKEPKLD